MNELEKSVEAFRVVDRICTNAFRQGASNPHKFAATIPTSLFGQKTGDPRTALGDYWDQIQRRLQESFFVDLVATFERLIFQKIANGSGEMKKSLRENYGERLPFHSSVEKFVKDAEAFSNLSGFKKELGDKIPAELGERLKAIIAYRDRLAHGKRFGSDVLPITIDEAYKTFSEILSVV